MLKLKPIAQVYKEKNLCIKYLKHQVNLETLINRLNIVKQANPSIICEAIIIGSLRPNLGVYNFLDP